MALNNINPTKTNAWEKLLAHYEQIKHVHLKELKENHPNRKKDFLLKFQDLEIDFSNNRISEETLQLLFQLAQQTDLGDAIHKYFSGDLINVTENRAVLHTALRDKTSQKIVVNQQNIIPEITETLQKIEDFTHKVLSGNWKGYTGKSITDVVNIGIGGSDLGPQMVVESLKYYKTPLNIHFVSNIDGDHVQETLLKLNPETTLFLIVSKTFTTQETLTNALTIKKWFLESGLEKNIKNHFVAVSANLKMVKDFGVADENIFPMWDWVGGRFSLWSAVGLSISLAIGFDNFNQLLAGAHQMDNHFKNTPFDKNIPVVLALISIWYNNFFETETEVILPYSEYLKSLAPYLQQAIMESNGKSVDRNGNKIDYQTGNIVWGSTGTNAQHAFIQLLHQGTKLIPADFIGFKESIHGLTEHHQKLMANFYAQIQALSDGKTKEEVHLDMKVSGQFNQIQSLLPFKVFEGNKPSNVILFDKLTPQNLGMLIAMCEHKIFVQGVIWNIYSYDQFGVELGKELANKIYNNS
ncbi:MAG: glucose-6-phosphate isomerase [Flavobacteriaceae bacterium]|nr:glucose-6-phosphate isomerase [Flavobacteriaceae bacterium]